MKDLLTHFCAGSILAISMAACSSDETILSNINNDDITFTSSVTRASGTTWASNDRIGVYMKTSSAAWDNSTLAGNSANVSYTTSNGSGVFTATSSALKYPQPSTTYDFVAYYPYSTTVTDGIYKVNVADQSKPAAIDLLYADNLKGVPASSTANPLSFSHKLSSLVLTITSTDGKDISGLKASVINVPSTADFNVKDATFSNFATPMSEIPMYTSGYGTTLTASAFLLPYQVITETGLQVKLSSADGQLSRTITLQDGNNALINSLESGKTYAVNINVKNIGETITPAGYDRWLETPTITDAQLKDTKLQYVTHTFTNNGKEIRNYSLLYNKDLKVAYWVAYPLSKGYLGSQGRTDEWAYDPKVPSQYQANIIKGSYTNGRYDYDRGHQLPSGDRTISKEANEQTFYATNMTPQVGKKFNQSIWAELENKVRGWSSNVDTLYVVTGVGFNDSNNITYTTDKDGKKVAVPDYFYKALLKFVDRKTGEVRTIAYKMDNQNYADKDFSKYAISVSDLEKLTGLTFFPQISEKDKAILDPTKWQ